MVGLSGGDRSGGSLAAAQALDDYGAEIYADFMQFYPTFDWAGFLKGHSSPRLFLVLLMGLPPESNLRSAWMGGPEHRPWTLDTHLLATVVELLQGANYQRGGGKGTQPKPLQRPKVKNQKSGHDRFLEIQRRARGERGGSGR